MRRAHVEPLRLVCEDHYGWCARCGKLRPEPAPVAQPADVEPLREIVQPDD